MSFTTNTDKNNDVFILINKKFTNIDISEHIYNFYLILKYFNGYLNTYNTNLFLTRFIDNDFYTNMILDRLDYRNNFNIYYLKKLFNNEKIITKILNKMPLIISHLNYAYRNNENIIKNLCSKDIYLFRYASNSLKTNIDFILKMLDLNINIYLYIDENLKSNFEIALKAVKKNPHILIFLPDNLRNNSIILAAALKNKIN